ncbi:hypothetical protein E3P94_00174 [Wallemia ichthyophaga]|nr:hypothetical protein E3P95_00174 [Wallemia ichthyophaga]TIB05505.1 hypothetical protein E3P94_00174 [Wallemia ichthyophaga]
MKVAVDAKVSIDVCRLFALVATTYVCYACLWGLVYRKFFFDMMGGALAANGIEPNDKINVIILITVTVPLIQILVLLHSLFNLLLFYPIKLFSNADSFNFKMYSLFLNGWFAILVYQRVYPKTRFQYLLDKEPSRLKFIKDLNSFITTFTLFTLNHAFIVPPFNRQALIKDPEVIQPHFYKQDAHLNTLDKTRSNFSAVNDDVSLVVGCVHNMDNNCQHTLQKRQKYNDGTYHGIGSLDDTRGSTSPPLQLPNDMDSSNIEDNPAPDDQESSSSPNDDDAESNQENQDNQPNDDIDSAIDQINDEPEELQEQDNNQDEDIDQSTDDVQPSPPSTNNAEDAQQSISDSSSTDFKVAYLSPIFIISGLVAAFTIMGLIYRKRRRSRLAKERQISMENGSSDSISEIDKPAAIKTSEGHLDEEPRHSSWQTDDDAQMMSPNALPFSNPPEERAERPWGYQPSGLASPSFRNEPWKWPSNNNTPKQSPRPVFQRTNSSFQPPSEITDQILKSPLPEGFQDASSYDVDRRLDEMSDSKNHNSGSMAFYANAMKSALDGERYKSGVIGNKIFSQRPSPQIDNARDAQIRQRKTSDKNAQQIVDNDESNYIPSAFSPPLRSSTPWGDFSQAIKTAFHPPKREPTPAAAGWLRNSIVPANAPREIEMEDVKQTKSPVDNVLTPISKDLQSPVPISYEQLKSDSNSTAEGTKDAKDTKKMDSPPPPLPKSPDRHAKRSKKFKLSKSKSKDLKDRISFSSPITMNAVVNENFDIGNQQYPEKSARSKEKSPHSPLLEKLARSPVPLSPNFAELARSDKSEEVDDGPFTEKIAGQSKFYTVKDMNNIRDEFNDEAARLREMAITPFVKGQDDKNGADSSIHTAMKQNESQLTPPGLSPEPQVASPLPEDAELAQLPFLPSPPLAGKKVHPPSWSLEAQVPRVVSPPPNAVSSPPKVVSPPPVPDWQSLPETLRSPPPQAVRSEMIFQANAKQEPPQSFGAALSIQPNMQSKEKDQQKPEENENEDESIGQEIETWSEGSGSTVFYEDETYEDDGIINIGRSNDASNESSRNDSIGGSSTRSKVRRYKTRRSAMSTSTRYRASQMTTSALMEENAQHVNNNVEQQQMVVDDWKNIENSRMDSSAPPVVDKSDIAVSPQSDEHFTSPYSGENNSPSKHTDEDFRSPMSNAFKGSEAASPKLKSPASSDFLPTIEATPELARSSTMKNYLMRLPSMRQSTGMGSLGINTVNGEALPSPMYDSYDSGNHKYNFIGKGQNESKYSDQPYSHSQEDSDKALAKVDDILTTSWSSRVNSDDLEEGPPRRRGAAVAPRTRKLLEARMRRETSGSPTSSSALSDC